MQLKLKQFVGIDESRPLNGIARRYWLDILLVISLAVTIGVVSYQRAQLIDSLIYYIDDVWFESDIPRIFSSILVRKSDHSRTQVHPLFSLISFVPVSVLRTALGIEAIAAVRMVVAAVASLWLGAFFILLRLMGCRRFDATLFSVLVATSAGAIFWFVVPETYPFGSLSIVLVLGFVALTQYRKFSSLWYAVISGLSLSVTVTNWMVGILATLVNYSRKRSLQITANAFCLVSLVWGVQKLFFPSAEFFLGSREKQFMLKDEAGGPLHVVKSFVFDTMVVPAIKVVDKFTLPEKLMSAQLSAPGSGSRWGTLAIALWIALLALGLWGLFRVKQHPKLRLVLGLTLVGQLALHLVYGDETFLYSLHFAPLLVLLAAWSTLTRFRLVALVLASVLVLCAGVNNSLQFSKATAFLSEQVPLRHLVKIEMQLRPTDPWPRGTGQVVLAASNNRKSDRAFHEPGGSFSPARGSFGVSLWLVDKSGNLKTTSDRIPPSEIQQELIQAPGQNPMEILTKTNYYQSVWSSAGKGRWMLDLKPQPNNDIKPLLIIRGVGPSNGFIRWLDWDGKQLLVNQRWIVTFDPAPENVYIGREGKDWMTERPRITKWQDENGWGYARVELADRNNWKMVIQDSFSAKGARS